MGAAAAMVAGGAMSAFGQLQQGEAAQKAGEFNSRVASQNARLSREAAVEEERKYKYMVRKQLGDNRAAIGASGLQMEGSMLDVLEDSVAQAQKDVLSIRHQGELKAWGFMQEAKLQKLQGQTAQQGAGFGAAASVLGSAGQAYYWNKKG